MKFDAKKLVSCALFFSSTALYTDGRVAPFLDFRSPGKNIVRKITGQTNQNAFLPDMESNYGFLSVTAEYERSFRPTHLAQCLFGNDITEDRILTITGSQTANRNNTTDWMAENFLLPRDFKGTIKFTPRVQAFILDWQLFVGLDEYVKGLYFRIYGPVAHTRYDLNPEERSQKGSIGYAAGFFAEAAVPVGTLLNTALDFFNGQVINTGGLLTFQPLPPTVPPTVPALIIEPLQFAKISRKKDRKTCFADLRGELGYTFVNNETYRFNFNLQVAAPTGNRPNAELLFESTCSNNKHWEFGVGLGFQWSFWQNEEKDHNFNLIIEADITHMFAAKQKRTFDLKGKPHSRYMLAQQLRSNANSNPRLAGNSNAGFEFGDRYAPVANFSTRDVKSSIGVQGDLALMLNWTSNSLSADIGYNFWGRSCEKIKFRDKAGFAFPENTWALKGDAHVIGFTVDPVNPVVRLAATESKATIHTGTNIPASQQAGALPANQNPGIDSPQLATSSAAPNPNVNATAGGGTQTNSSVPPIFIKESDLDLEGAATRGISHKIFGHFSYTWIDHEKFTPFLGIGVGGEFGARDKKATQSTTTTDNPKCLKCSISKWGIFVKGGMNFN